MPSVEGLTPDILWYTLVGIIGIGAIVVLFDKISDVIKKHNRTSGGTLVGELEEQDKRISAIEEGNKVLCRGILALLSHEINGNSIDKLTSAQQEITDYLIDK